MAKFVGFRIMTALICGMKLAFIKIGKNPEKKLKRIVKLINKASDIENFFLARCCCPSLI